MDRNRDIRGFGEGIGTQYHNDPEAHHQKQEEERRETTARERLYNDMIEVEAVVISDNGEKFGGSKETSTGSEQSGKTLYYSVMVRLIGPSGNEQLHPNQQKTDPLSAKNEDEFLRLRSQNDTRAVIEKENSTFTGIPEIGTIVKCVQRNGVWEIIAKQKRNHVPYDEFIKRLDSGDTGGKDTMESKGSNGCCGPGCSRHPGSPGYGTGASGGSAGGGYAGSQQSSKKPPKAVANAASNCDVPIEGRALLDMIAFNESRGAYNIRYGGDQAIEITDFSDHPRKAERITRGYNTGKKSSAAGRYQFIEATWDSIAKQEGLKDFSPESQDQAAYALAVRDYKKKTGRDLQKDLKSGTPDDLNRIGRALSATWTSLPGSTSGEQLTSDSQFVEGYNNLLENQKRIERINGNGCSDNIVGTSGGTFS